MLISTGSGAGLLFGVTGPGGFIGGAACRAVLEAGGRVIGLGPGEMPDHPSARQAPVAIDDVSRLAECLAGVSVLIHAAGRGTPSSVDRLDGAVAAAELRLAAQVMEAALQAGVSKLVLVSSGGTVYGDAGAGQTITETRPVQPSSRYGAVKAMVEQMALSFTRAGLLECVVARLSNPYGPGQRNRRGQGLIATLIEALLQGATVPVWGDGTVVRDYLYVDDAARGLLAAARLPGGSVCNVSSGIGRSVNAVIEDLSRLLGCSATMEFKPWRDGGMMRNVLSHALLSRETGWQPSVDWQDGLRQTVAWWRDHLGQMEQGRWGDTARLTLGLAADA